MDPIPSTISDSHPMSHFGITITPSQPLDQSGANQAAYTLGELLLHLGHRVTWLYRGKDTWWKDIPLPASTTAQHYTAIPSPLDGLIDVDGVYTADERARVARTTIVFLRTFLQFSEMDKSVYIECPYRPRTMEGVREVWCWDILNPAYSIPSIQTLFPCPIRRVPFLWSSALTDLLGKDQRAFYVPADPSWKVHVAEKTTNESSAIVPLVAIRELHRTQAWPSSTTYHIHNTATLQTNQFFKENIALNLELATLPAMLYKERTPFHHLIGEPNTVVLSHSRFTPLRTSLLQWVWRGVPLFHNSPVLRDLHPTLRAMYYEGNNIQQLLRVCRTFQEDPKVWYAAGEARREAIRQAYGIQAHEEEWKTCLSVFSEPIAPALPALPVTPLPPVAPLPPAALPAAPPVAPLPPAAPLMPSTAITPPETLCIAFSDMWPGFNTDRNFITDTLRHYYPTMTVHGTLYEPSDTALTPHLVIVGPYSEAWKSIPATIPTGYLTGENWHIQDDPAVALYLSPSRQEDDRHFRLPT